MTDEYKDIDTLPHFKVLKMSGSLSLLKETVSGFFNCKVEIMFKPLKELKDKFNIDIFANPRRGFYPINSDNVIIVVRILKDRKLQSSLALHLNRSQILLSSPVLNEFESAVSAIFSRSFKDFFDTGTLLFGEELIKRTITNYIAKGYFDYRQIRHLIDYFFRLRTTSFEGKFFSTGLIITKAFHDFEKRNGANRYGSTFNLKHRFSIRNSNIIDKRIWYLIDGKKTFYLGNKHLEFDRIFVIDTEYSNKAYLDSHSLSLSLKGGDALFKIENEKLFTINLTSGIEFLFFENQWKFRDYNLLKHILQKHFNPSEDLINSLIFYILYCSKNQISSIIWIPEEYEQIDNLININTKNNLITTDLSINDKRFINHIFRYLSSDGATVISKEGTLKHFGVIVDISKAAVKGIKGTGETAASILSSNGMSLKISQDGTIKVFLEPQTETIKF